MSCNRVNSWIIYYLWFEWSTANCNHIFWGLKHTYTHDIMHTKVISTCTMILLIYRDNIKKFPLKKPMNRIMDSYVESTLDCHKCQYPLSNGITLATPLYVKTLNNTNEISVSISICRKASIYRKKKGKKSFSLFWIDVNPMQHLQWDHPTKWQFCNTFIMHFNAIIKSH